MKHSTSNILPVFITALHKITNIALKEFAEISYLQISNQNSNFSYAGQAVKILEQKLYEDISKIKPKYSFIFQSGKTVQNKDASNYVIINSICGIHNFQRGIPYFAISLSLLRDNKIFAAAIYNPVTREMFTSELNNGSLYNQRRLKDLNNSDLAELSVATDIKGLSQVNPTIFKQQYNPRVYINNCLILDLCYLASGKYNLCCFSDKYNYFEILAALLVLQEANYGLSINDDADETKVITKLNAYNANVGTNLKI